jgi:hypothetical protein
MPAHRKHLTPFLLALVAGATLVVHSRAEARRFESTVIVGRVTARGRLVAGTAITVAGRPARAVSGTDGRYSINVARSSESERITLMARASGYETWQRPVTLSGDTIRIDVSLVALTQLEDTAVQPQIAARKDAAAAPAPAEQHRGDVRSRPIRESVVMTAPGSSANATRVYAPEPDRGIRRPREPGNT